jgi:hypothetical protein
MTEAVKPVAYAPAPAPARPEALPVYIAAEFERIAAALRALASGRIEPSHRPPDKPRDGDIRLTDGVSWDPGGGAGVYAWYGGGWNRLG